jgi:hypothetical protein
MSIEIHPSQRIAASLFRQVQHGASTTQIADAIISAWLEIDVALTPLIGRGGVAALYKRSLYLTAPTYMWLGGTHEGVQAALDPAPLRAALVQQNSETAAAAGGLLLQTFNELLASLVGTSLTERLLRSVWANALSGPPAQDSTQ